MRFVVLFISTWIAVFLMAAPASAQTHRRLVDFEWEPIDGAHSYELELRESKKSGRLYKFKVKSSAWNGKLTPGKYDMRLRALDYRGVPGDWSETSPFDVGLEAAKLVSPAPQAAIASKDDEESTVDLRWQPVGGASSYDVTVTSADGSVKKTETVREPRLRMELPVAHAYSWEVNAISSNGLKSDAPALGEFELLGKKIEKPRIEVPENEFVREVKWKPSPMASKYDVAVARFNPKVKKWERVQEFKNHPSESIPFDDKWEGGTYRVDVRAAADRRVASDVVSTKFKVRRGDRSPAAEFTHEVRKSIDRVNGWYGIASYLITMVKYSSQDYDSNALVSYPAIGGTGRLGAGYFKEDRPWGFLGILDMSGFVNDEGQNVTSTSMEASAVYRSALSARGELRTHLGLFYKEHQMAIGNPTTNKVVSYENAAVIGPHVGTEYWYSLTPKLGFQLNAHLYYAMMKQKTPNGGALDPSLSTQFGFMGSYRFNRRFTGLAGYARREDVVKYKTNTTDSRFQGLSNEARLEGDYLNFFAEYSF